jgi:hypothetical protein
MRKYTALIVLVLILLKVGDLGLVRLNSNSRLNEESRFFHFDWLPYTGYHTPAHVKFPRNPVFPLLDQEGLNVKTGDFGFFIDFPLADPPKKLPGEFRLILIGGSTAQGFGAKSNAEMFYSVLEKSINDELKAKNSGKRFRVINLAMASSNTFQNFIALNLWGHQLEPDAIMSLSGSNDIASDSDMFEGGYVIGGFLYSQRPTRASWFVRTLSFFYPGIFRYSVMGPAVRSFGLADDAKAYRMDYLASRPTKDKFSATVAFYVEALRSITRDFPQVPLLLVAQPSADQPEAAQFFDEAFLRLDSDVKAGKIITLNAYDYWKSQGFLPGTFVDGRHFTAKGNQILTEYLAKPVFELIDKSK